MLNTRDRKHLISPLYYEFKEVPDLSLIHISEPTRP